MSRIILFTFNILFLSIIIPWYYSCRATKGKFKSFKDLKKLNWTEKKVERFMQVRDEWLIVMWNRM